MDLRLEIHPFSKLDIEQDPPQFICNLKSLVFGLSLEEAYSVRQADLRVLPEVDHGVLAVRLLVPEPSYLGSGWADFN